MKKPKKKSNINLTAKKKMDFLEELARTGNVSASARKIGFSRVHMYEIKRKDEMFRKMWKDAEKMAVDALIEEARRRAVEGVEHPIYHKDKKIDTLKKYSDTLLIVLLKAHDPRFQDNKNLKIDANVSLTDVLKELDARKTSEG